MRERIWREGGKGEIKRDSSGKMIGSSQKNLPSSLFSKEGKDGGLPGKSYSVCGQPPFLPKGERDPLFPKRENQLPPPRMLRGVYTELAV
jgi:hypothetical protein